MLLFSQKFCHVPGDLHRVEVDEVEEPGGVEATREVIRHSGAAAALPVLDDGRVAPRRLMNAG